MIPFFSTSAPHYHTDICPNGRCNASAHTHTCPSTSTHTYTACNITIIHCSAGTLYPLQTTLHNKWTFSDCWPFLFAPSFSLFLPVWCSLMDANGHLIGSVPKMEINGELLFFFSPVPMLFWAVLRSAVCGENVNEEERGDAATAGLIENSLLQTGPRSRTIKRRKACMGPMCDSASMPIY